MEKIDVFYGIWNRKYPELAGRISHSIERVRNMNGSVSTELILQCLDDNGDEGMYYKMSYITKIIFGAMEEVENKNAVLKGFLENHK